jgi:hypothetical protein
LRRFFQAAYQAKSWSRARKVIARVEATSRGADSQCALFLTSHAHLVSLNDYVGIMSQKSIDIYVRLDLRIYMGITRACSIGTSFRELSFELHGPLSAAAAGTPTTRPSVLNETPSSRDAAVRLKSRSPSAIAPLQRRHICLTLLKELACSESTIGCDQVALTTTIHFRQGIAWFKRTGHPGGEDVDHDYRRT